MGARRVSAMDGANHPRMRVQWERVPRQNGKDCRFGRPNGRPKGERHGWRESSAGEGTDVNCCLQRSSYFYLWGGDSFFICFTPALALEFPADLRKSRAEFAASALKRS